MSDIRVFFKVIYWILMYFFVRYLTRKIGFEAVMRIRCSRGMSLHTFHGHFFVRSTDLLSLPNVNPDSAFGMQVRNIILRDRVWSSTALTVLTLRSPSRMI